MKRWQKWAAGVGFTLAAIEGAALAQGTVNPWTYTATQAVLAANALMSGTVTITNLVVTGSANLPAAGISCASLPTTTGDVVNSSTCVQTIQAGVVTNAKLANTASNSLKGNATGSSAVTTDVPVPAKTGAVNWAAASGFGGWDKGQEPATATNDDACVGCVGEYLTFTMGATSFVTGVFKDIGTFALTAGDWDCSVQGSFTQSGGATQAVLSIGTVADTPPSILSGVNYSSMLVTFTNSPLIFNIGPGRIKTTGATFHVVGAMTFVTTGTGSAFVGCRRAR